MQSNNNFSIKPIDTKYESTGLPRSYAGIQLSDEYVEITDAATQVAYVKFVEKSVWNMFEKAIDEHCVSEETAKRWYVIITSIAIKERWQTSRICRETSKCLVILKSEMTPKAEYGNLVLLSVDELARSIAEKSATPTKETSKLGGEQQNSFVWSIELYRKYREELAIDRRTIELLTAVFGDEERNRWLDFPDN